MRRQGSFSWRIDPRRGHNDPDNANQVKTVSKPDVLSEAFDMLRRRFSLAEKVYFHRTKKSASSMLISAVGEAGLGVSDLWDLSDEEVVRLLSEHENPRVKRLGEAFRDRSLYKPSLYRLRFRERQDRDADSIKLWDVVYAKFRDAKQRLETERELEDLLELPKGSVSIYCPDRDMNLKRFEMLVQYGRGSEVKMFRQLLDHTRKAEMDALDVRFHELWALEVFIDPRVLDAEEIGSPQVALANGFCESADVFGLPNDNTALRGKVDRVG